MISVLVVDDHAVVRAGLSHMLGAFEGIDLVGAAGGGSEAVDLVVRHHPDVVLMDLSMPFVDGIEATKRVLSASPHTRIVALTSFSDRERILEAFDAGATGYLLKDAEPEELRRAIEAAARGESPVDPKAAGALLSAMSTGKPGDDLTARESEILKLVGEGLANKQIARRLGISEKTVKTHLTNVFQRIGVSDRTQAALWAERHGLL